MRQLYGLMVLYGLVLFCTLILLSACGPTYLERRHAEDLRQQQAACQADPQACLLYQYLAGQAAQEQPRVIYMQPQRGVLWPWPAVGGRRYPGNPIGYVP